MPLKLYRQILADTTGESSWQEAQSSIEAKGNPDFSVASSTEEGMFATLDNYGTSYYFRGVQENNYVLFADMLWRVMRIDGSNNLKLILYNESSEGTVYRGINSGTAIAFNSTSTTSLYGGYMYTSSQLHGNGTDSTVKKVIDVWYENNILDTEYEDYIANNAIYCNDRVMYSNSSGTTASTSVSSSASSYFASYMRLQTTSPNPTLECSNVLDAFTVEESEFGNGALNYSIALITMDEFVFAGGRYGSTSYNYMYQNAFYIMTMTPNYYYYNSSSKRYIYIWYIPSGQTTFSLSSSTIAVPVTISLNESAQYESGDGSLENPYTIKM